MSRLFIDIETRSELDVTKVGAFAYAKHPSTEILCMAYAADEGPVHLWTPGGPWPFPTRPPTIVAHNIDFEREVIAAKIGNAYSECEWVDTAALSARMGLPRNLEDLGDFFGYPKDMEGNRIMRKLCAPRRPSRDDPSKWWTPSRSPRTSSGCTTTAAVTSRSCGPSSRSCSPWTSRRRGSTRSPSG